VDGFDQDEAADEREELPSSRSGEASDSRNFEVLLDLGPDVDPRAAETDSGG
jgi:hypothetical protein